VAEQPKAEGGGHGGKGLTISKLLLSCDMRQTQSWVNLFILGSYRAPNDDAGASIYKEIWQSIHENMD
jgi:hypothetical protein